MNGVCLRYGCRAAASIRGSVRGGRLPRCGSPGMLGGDLAFSGDVGCVLAVSRGLIGHSLLGASCGHLAGGGAKCAGAVGLALGWRVMLCWVETWGGLQGLSAESVLGLEVGVLDSIGFSGLVLDDSLMVLYGGSLVGVV